jgi:hypothetical protein
MRQSPWLGEAIVAFRSAKDDFVAATRFSSEYLPSLISARAKYMIWETE